MEGATGLVLFVYPDPDRGTRRVYYNEETRRCACDGPEADRIAVAVPRSRVRVRKDADGKV